MKFVSKGRDVELENGSYYCLTDDNLGMISKRSSPSSSFFGLDSPTIGQKTTTSSRTLGRVAVWRAGFSRYNTVQQIYDMVQESLTATTVLGEEQVPRDRFRIWLLVKPNSLNASEQDEKLVLLPDSQRQMTVLDLLRWSWFHSRIRQLSSDSLLCDRISQFEDPTKPCFLLLKLLLEVRNSDLTWPEECEQTRATILLANKTASPRGLVGLANLGNTCYINSTIQAINSVAPLVHLLLNLDNTKSFFRMNQIAFDKKC
ncbi:Ubiquitin carboxyl-terminal hydrolase 32 [Cichlidogyrus casuarinus]|uniref:Ubiquitin carboxyl-terminal hydrolase 32 n=1 Tax=Cichlidogyrus casuarinus TaxID=1844966 RepID=A0ABD2Q7Z6_9PLAT